jgi:hypothetical protein
LGEQRAHHPEGVDFLTVGPRVSRAGFQACHVGDRDRWAAVCRCQLQWSHHRTERAERMTYVGAKTNLNERVIAGQLHDGYFGPTSSALWRSRSGVRR